MRNTALALITVGSTVLTPGTAYACRDNDALKLSANDAVAGEGLGNSVDIDGTLAVVGAYFDDDNGPLSGSAYLFDPFTGQQLFKLLPGDGAGNDWFGVSVAVSGSRAIVGAYLDDDNDIDSGSAYLFDTATGQELFKLLAQDGAMNDRFGESVAIDGAWAVVGAGSDGDNGLSSGSAYVFDTATGQQLFKLLPSDGAAGDNFGRSVAISGSLVLVGAWRDDDNGQESGSAYLFDAVTGQEITKLHPADASSDDRFGTAVALHGDRALIGAYGDNPKGSFSGSAYLFDLSSGQQVAKLLPSDGAPADQFGFSVALSGAVAIVGAHGNDDHGAATGSAYLFDGVTGQSIVKFLSPDAAKNDFLGLSVGASADRVLIGAPRQDEAGPDSGAVYALTVVPGLPIGVSYCGPAVPNSSGDSGTIAAFGSDAAADNCVRLDATGLALDQFGYFLVSDAQGLVQPPGSQGNLCLGGAIGRYSDDVLNSLGTGAFALQIDLTNLPTVPAHSVQPGETWYFQAWFRDVNPVSTSNFTDGVGITFV